MTRTGLLRVAARRFSSRRQTSIALLWIPVVLIGLVGCSLFSYHPSPLETTVLKLLGASEASRTATVDFDQIVEGDWTRLIIVCWGATNAELNESLGFEWAHAPNLRSENVGPLLVFADDKAVVAKLGPERDEEGRGPVVNTCTPVGSGGEESPLPLEVLRSDSALTYSLDDSGLYGRPVWYLDTEETARLVDLQKGRS